MKIFYLSTAEFPSEVTHTLSVMRVCQAMADLGHKVELTGRSTSTLDSPAIFSRYGVAGSFNLRLFSVHHLLDNRYARALLLPGLLLAWKNARALRSFKPDLVYSRLTLAELFAVPPESPLIFEMHSAGAFNENWLKRAVFRRLILRLKTRRIIVTTDTLAAYLKRQWPGVEVRVARLSTVPPIPMTAGDIQTFREQQLQGRQFTHHVGYTGYLDTTGLRGTRILCEIARRLPDVAIHVVGGEPSTVAQWENFAQDYNEHGNLFFYGHRNPAEMPLFLACFDIALAPLQRVTKPLTMMSPLKIPQYMSYGKAIVASDLVAHRELLTHGEHALLVESEDSDAWANAVRTLLSDSHLRATLGANAYKRYATEFTPEYRLARILENFPPGRTS